MYIQQLPSGSWRVTVQHRGQVRRGTRPTKAAARMMGAELQVELGARPTLATLTVDELLDAHMVAHEYADTTRADFVSVLGKLRDAHPPILALRVRDCARADVDMLYRQLRRQGWTDHRVDRLHTLMGSAFSRAVRYQWAHDNPCRGVAPPSPAAPDINPPSDGEVRRIIADAPTPTFGAFLRLAASIGARRGEMVALQWHDFDLDAGRVIIRRSVVNATGGRIVEREGKTGRRGHRTVTIRGATVDALRSHRTHQAEVAMGAGTGAPMWVWSHDGGLSPWRPDYVSKQYARHVATLGIDTTFHQLRHYVATTLLSTGETPATVAGMLGHSIATLLSVYAHYIVGSDGDAADEMARRLG